MKEILGGYILNYGISMTNGTKFNFHFDKI